MAYNNRVFQFVADYPIVAFFVVPVGIKLAGTATRMVTGLGSHHINADDMGNVVTEGGDAAGSSGSPVAGAVIESLLNQTSVA